VRLLRWIVVVAITAALNKRTRRYRLTTDKGANANAPAPIGRAPARTLRTSSARARTER